jgi:hypothetical protein
MVSEESLLCRCCNNDVPVSYYVEGVSFEDKIFDVGFESLSVKWFSIWVVLCRFHVVSSVYSTNVPFHGVED